MRATLHYLQGRDDESVAAIGRALGLHPQLSGIEASLIELTTPAGSRSA